MKDNVIDFKQASKKIKKQLEKEEILDLPFNDFHCDDTLIFDFDEINNTIKHINKIALIVKMIDQRLNNLETLIMAMHTSKMELLQKIDTKLNEIIKKMD